MSEIRVDRFKAEDGISAPQFPNGLQVTGVVTATVLDTSVPFLNVGSNAKLGATGVVTATSFTGGSFTGTTISGTTGSFSGSVSIGGTLTYEDVTSIDSIGIVTAREGVRLPDSKKIELGDSQDLEIYHDGSNSYVRDNGTGDLILKGSEVRIQSGNSTETKALFKNDGGVELYYNNAKTLETFVNATHFFGNASECNLDFKRGDNGQRIGFFGITNGGQVKINGEDGVGGGYETYLEGNLNGATKLFYDNTAKLTTSNTGVTVTGTLAATAVTGDGSGLTGVVAVPTGAIMAWPVESAPTGFILCHGQAISRSTYSDLYGLIGVMYGAGDGSANFNLPDYRGQFLRGRANGSTNDPDRGSRTDRGDGNAGDNVGTKQDYGLLQHSHGNNSNGTNNHGFNTNNNNTGAFSKSGHSYGGTRASSHEIITNSWGTNHANVSGHVTNNEIRPINIYVNWIIKS